MRHPSRAVGHFFNRDVLGLRCLGWRAQVDPSRCSECYSVTLALSGAGVFGGMGRITGFAGL